VLRRGPNGIDVALGEGLKQSFKDGNPQLEVSGSAGGYEYRSFPGAISPTLAHTDIHNLSGSYPLADSEVDGFEKTIIVWSGSGTFTIPCNFLRAGSLSGVGASIALVAGAGVRLQWSAANERWAVRGWQGTVTFNIGGGS
jgi:hypothetical protein